ncbi:MULTISPECIES: FAD-dependent monooxygenase [Actinosynnema]|uniref:FAD-dependent monooxygenase n=1 Tax=Actinosynnema TaxID=40566 RepID=UPI0020A34FCC|nr:FAD-dependent monooxygenase [Actinosynnema pretiosum]MCP2097787.1 2-polyprenyl-6-methoxyphenol hydroxylase [Actinosynnema pretiosum]
MRIAVIGGGPGGLYFAALVKQVAPGHEVVLWERGGPEDAFGFGVVFSDGALGGVQAADPELFDSVVDHFVRWESVDVRHRGRTTSHEGYRFSAVGRRALLRLLRERCAHRGVVLRFGSTAPPLPVLRAGFDLVVAADGVGSATRAGRAEAFGAHLEPRDSRYLWMGTDRVFDALTFAVVETPHGPLQVHAYPYAPGRSTFIVETTDRVLRAGDLERPDRSPEATAHAIAALLAEDGDLLGGHRLLCAGSRWGRFTSVRNDRWSDGNAVLLGDAAHTTHFSIGSGTKLAMEDAVALAMALTDHDDLPDALAAYEAERKPAVERMQRVAEVSRDWFEHVDERVGLPPDEFTLDLLTRSGRIGHRDLPLLDRDHVERVRNWFTRAQAATA